MKSGESEPSPPRRVREPLPSKRVGRPRRNGRALTRPPEEEILHQAGRLFCERGFAGTGTRDIAEAAGLQQSSLFHYFPTKEAILVALSERALGKPLLELDGVRAAQGTPTEKLFEVVQRYVEHLCSRPVDLLAVLSSPAELPRSRFRRYLADLDRFMDGIAEIIDSGVGSGEFVASDPNLETRKILGLCNNWTLRWYWKTGTLSAAQIAADFASSVVRSMGVDAATAAALAEAHTHAAQKPSVPQRVTRTSRA